MYINADVTTGVLITLLYFNIIKGFPLEKDHIFTFGIKSKSMVY